MAANFEKLIVNLFENEDAEFYYDRKTRKFGLSGGKSIVLPANGKLTVNLHGAHVGGPCHLDIYLVVQGKESRLDGVKISGYWEDNDRFREAGRKIWNWIGELGIRIEK